MEFDLQWLLISLPLAFAVGWLASRLDIRQVRGERSDSPRAYYKGLNLLLNEQHDKAIDAFIEAVQHDPDTTELHFALGNLFRRRGEFERAVRVHQHLLTRADLSPTDHDRAQHALAQDYMKAGLFDRAEAAYKALEGTPFDTEARLALLNLYERSREWRAAAETAGVLERNGIGSFSTRIAHHWCEQALEDDAQGRHHEAAEALRKARQAAPQAPRPLLLSGQRALKAGQPTQALVDWREMYLRDPTSFHLIAVEFARNSMSCGQHDAASNLLNQAYEREPSVELLRAIAMLEGTSLGTSSRLLPHLQKQPTLTAAQALLADTGIVWNGTLTQAVLAAVTKAAKPLQRYHCAACGFETQRYFWQCPGCLSWDSFPPRHIDEQ